MAHQRGVKTWLKMVESQEIKTYALSLGIDYTQGKILSAVTKKG
jgi:EAL domain-containing protein (putative c-di-GMP-specific phosphodiesterase class I)